MKKKYIVEITLNKVTIFVPVDAINEDKARYEVLCKLYWTSYDGIDMEIINVTEIIDGKIEIKI